MKNDLTLLIERKGRNNMKKYDYKIFFPVIIDLKKEIVC